MLKRVFLLILMTVLITTLYGCTAIDVSQYAGKQPNFNLYEYFQGSTKGWGVVQDRKGNLTRQFVVDIQGTVNSQGELVLDEDFTWNDGEISKRVWTIAKMADHNYSGKAEDVNGEASGLSYGNVLNWKYQLNLEVDGSTWKINFDDWMFLQPDNVLINRAIMSKFGFRVGEVTIVFLKQ